MEQNRTRLTLVNLLALLIAAAAGFVIARMAHSFTAYAVLPFVALGFAVSAVSYFHMRLVERERLEQFEYDELTKSPSASALFNKGEADTLPARRSRRQFEKFFLPGITFLLLLGETASVFILWRWLDKAQVTTLDNAALFAAISGILFVVLFLLGRFSLSLSKLAEQRLLRPVASFVLGDAYLMLVAAVMAVFVIAGFPHLDLYVARGLVILLGLVGLETLLTLLLEIYRPRVRGAELRLLHESRLMGLLAQPESLFTTAAHALDYQFGFAVSQTRFFQILQKQLAWIIVAQVVLLVLSTTMVVIDAGEQALLERFGKPVAGRGIIGPGLHLKFPWPIDKIHRYSTDRIQEFEVGLPKEEDHDERGDNTVLWTVSHTKEEFNLLVASREAGSTTNADETKKSPPVNLLSVGIPVQFQITNLTAWAYSNAQPDSLLEKLSAREVVRYLVSADLNEIMSTARDSAAEELRRRIQTVANERNLGARIVFVGLQDIHPPVGVAGAYEKVVGSLQTREARILSAKAQAVHTNALAGALAYKSVRDAEAERDRTKALALARAASFTNQLPAFRAGPEVYTERAYLQALSRNGGSTRKYVLATTNTADVILFNLEEKLRTDLLDVQMPAPKAK
jgi:modulator of FtsH protease HflK